MKKKEENLENIVKNIAIIKSQLKLKTIIENSLNDEIKEKLNIIISIKKQLKEKTDLLRFLINFFFFCFFLYFRIPLIYYIFLAFFIFLKLEKIFANYESKIKLVKIILIYMK